MKLLGCVLSLVVTLTVPGWGQDLRERVRHVLPLVGTVERSLDRVADIFQALEASDEERWESPRCLQAWVTSPTEERSLVRACEGTSGEEPVVLVCTSPLPQAAHGVCELIRTSYLAGL